MATLGGNLLQRTRSTYFRHTDMPVYLDGADTASQASEGVDTSLLAILGNDGRLVGMYPGDFAVSVVAFDAQLSMEGPDGSRTIAARDFYRTPGKSFQYTTVLKQGELITSISFPISASLRNSMYLKIRERSSYAFALASASVGLQLEGSGKTAKIVAANVGLGGLASIPWHSEPAVESLVGKQASDSTFEKAAEAALADAKPPAGLEYKIPLAKRTLMRALRTLRDQGPPDDSQLWSFQHGRA
jgi:xanthine dehydrogenase YagS FAD-binding subunit